MGKFVGLKVCCIINELMVVVLVYGFYDWIIERKFCVIDLGGGMFDVIMMDVFEGMMEIVVLVGESMLGGEDFIDCFVFVVL